MVSLGTVSVVLTVTCYSVLVFTKCVRPQPGSAVAGNGV